QTTKPEVRKCYSLPEELETAIGATARTKANHISELSARFSTLIPHAFGRRVPPPISTLDLLHKKVDMLNVLNDIELALGMQKKESDSVKEEALLPNPADENYQKLKAQLEWVDPATPEFEFIKT